MQVSYFLKLGIMNSITLGEKYLKNRFIPMLYVKCCPVYVSIFLLYSFHAIMSNLNLFIHVLLINPSEINRDERFHLPEWRDPVLDVIMT